MNKAPLLRTHTASPRLLNLEQVYGAWAEHYEKCSACNRQDYFDPHVSWLCQRGQYLFKQWEQTAMSTSRIVGLVEWIEE